MTSATFRAGAEDRVLLIVRTPPPFGGGEAVGAQLERTFAGRFSLLTFRRPGHDKAAQGRFRRSNVLFGLRYIVTGVTRLLRSRPRVLYIDVPKDRAAFLRTAPILATALALRIRVVGDLAGADFAFLESGPATSRLGRAVLTRLFAIRVLGERIAETLRGRGLRNSVVIPNGIDEPPGADSPRPALSETVELLYVGKLAMAKGLDTLVEGADLFTRGGRRARIHLVGEWEGPETRAAMLRSIEERGLRDVVVLHGLLVGDAKWELFRAAHLLVHPSRWDGQPVTVLEALAFGIPVVATNVGAIGDTIRDGVDGRLMHDFSAAALVAGVEGVLRSAETYEQYSREARRAYEERFTAATFAERLSELLSAALHEPEASAG